jgi:excisionase family DNA binding protein
VSTQQKFESVSSAAKRLGLSRQWVQRLAHDGRIPGAQRLGPKAWAIPSSWEYQRIIDRR